MRRIPYIGPTKPQGDLSGIWSMYDQYQLSQSGQWTTTSIQQQWTRPDDWLPMPSVAPGEKKFVGLYGVWPLGIANTVGINCNDDFTVDWGDGTAPQNYSAGGAFYAYNFADIDPGTLTSQGYKQVIITVTPQPGKTITNLITIDYTGVDGIAPVQTGFNWLDLNVQLSDLTNLSIGYTYAYGRNTINCQRVVVGPNQITNFSNRSEEHTSELQSH